MRSTEFSRQALDGIPRGVPIRASGLTGCPRVNTLGLAWRLGVALTLVCRAGAQDYLIDAWHTKDGLPQGSVTCIVQTRDGYLWLGTQNGLVRFDGYRFVVFNSRNTPAIRNNRVVRLLEDRHESLWILTEEPGQARFWQGQFSAHPPPPGGSPGDYARTVCEDAEEGWWITSVEGRVSRWRQGAFAALSDNWGLSRATRSTMTRDRGGRVYLGTDQELAIWRDGEFQVVWGRAQEPGFDVEFMTASRAGGCWVAANGRLRRFDDGQWREDSGVYAWTNRTVYGLCEDSRGSVWVATMGDGLFCYRTNRAVLHLNRSDGLPTDFVRCVTEDREGNIWVGLENGGLCRLKPAVFQSYGRQQGLSSDQVMGVCESSEGEFWIGTNGDGLNRLQSPQVERFGPSDGLTDGHVWSVLRDVRGVVWAGAWTGLFKREADRFVRVAAGLSQGRHVLALYEDEPGTVWVGRAARNGLVRLRDGMPEEIPIAGAEANLDVRAISRDADGSLWVGTQGDGLFRLKDGEWTRFGFMDGLASEVIWCLYADRDGALWIGTHGGGLSRWRQGKLATCTTQQGLINDVICQILEDDRGHLWLGSHGGVFRVRKEELNRFAEGAIRSVRCLGFTELDGLPTIECSGGFQPSGCKSRDGRLWFPTVKGLAVVDPRQVTFNPLPPLVVIEEASVDGRLVPLNRPTGDAGNRHAGLTVTTSGNGMELRISPGRHQLQVRYTGLSFTAPQRVRFRRLLEGLEEAWGDVGPQRSADYSYLSPGRYRFRVTACNNDGVWNEAGATLAITVLPHFWQTGWFRLSMLGLLVGLSAGATRVAANRRLQRRLRRLEQERALERERTRIARDIHDDLGALVTRVSMLAEQAGGDDGTRGPVQRHLVQIGNTAREMVRVMDATVWAVNPSNDTLSQLADYLLHYAEEFLRPIGVVCRVDMPTEPPNWPLSAEVRHNLFLVVRESLNNVAKHAGATEVRLELKLTDTRLGIAIRDNGCGFDSSAPRSRGHGLNNMLGRIQQLSGHLAVESAPAAGTTIRLELDLAPDFNRIAGRG